jgi:rhomboid domain-containing protein 1
MDQPPALATRLTLGAFVHLDTYHLYYNMLSLWWKGAYLESFWGTRTFVQTLGGLALLTNALHLALSYGVARVFKRGFYLNQPSVGFSGLIFALKAVANSHAPRALSTLPFIGLSIENRFAAWAELVLMRLIFPQVTPRPPSTPLLSGCAR